MSFQIQTHIQNIDTGPLPFVAEFVTVVFGKVCMCATPLVHVCVSSEWCQWNQGVQFAKRWLFPQLFFYSLLNDAIQRFRCAGRMKIVFFSRHDNSDVRLFNRFEAREAHLHGDQTISQRKRRI